MFGQEPARSARGNGPKPWPVVALSVLGSAGAVAAVGFLCALIYPILKGKRAALYRTRKSGSDQWDQKRKKQFLL